MEKAQKSIEELPLDKTWVSRHLHIERNEYNLEPKGTLICKRLNIFVDDNGNIWHKMPWYYNMFHNPIKNSKLIHYDSNFIGEALGSSEIIVSKSSIQKDKYSGKYSIMASAVKKRSYNYRDGYVSSKWKHFVADIFPNVAYCTCSKS